jgi:hypothetical protein
MATVKVEYNKNTNEYFAHVNGQYVHGPDLGKVCELVQRCGGRPKTSMKAGRAHENKLKGN